MSAQVAWFPSLARSSSFTFAFSVPTPTCYQFSATSSPSTYRPQKRRRPLWDVDGSTALGKKKRRLRLNLITSRLSKPFSSPASNVADHGVGKVTIYRGAKGSVLEKGDLRKAAIMNSVRKRVEDMKAGNARRKEMAMLPPPMTEAPTHSQLMCQMALRDILLVKPRTPESSPSLPPSPLGLSNYDALDLEDEDDFGARYGSDEYDSDEGSSSGVSAFGPSKCCVEGENYDFLDEMDGISHDGIDSSYDIPERRWWG